MAATHCKQTIRNRTDHDLIRKFPLHYLDPQSEVRKGFESGILIKATFEMEPNTTVIYERIEE